jgi:transcription elongation factor Elf1
MPRAKGTTTARGYGSRHQARRRAIAKRLAAGAVLTCWRCGGALVHGMAWDLGHDDEDRSQYRGPEHRRCNRSAGASKGNRIRGREKSPRPSSSDAAIRLWRKPSQTCPICGALFVPSYSGVRTCGRACGLELRRRNAPLKVVKIRTPKLLTCSECGQSFKATWVRVTCSQSCAIERNRRTNRQLYQRRIGLPLT